MSVMGDRRALGAIAVAMTIAAIACSSRHRLGRLEGDEPGGAGRSHDTEGAGAPSTEANGGASSSSSSGSSGQAGEGAGGGAAAPPAPGVFVAH